MGKVWSRHDKLDSCFLAVIMLGNFARKSAHLFRTLILCEHALKC